MSLQFPPGYGKLDLNNNDPIRVQIPEAIGALFGSQVFELLLRSKRPLDAEQIAVKTGFAREIVEDSVVALMDRDLIVAEARHKTIRRSTFRTNHERYGAIGIKILPGKLVSIVTNLLAQQRSEPVERALPRSDPASLIASVAELVNDLRATHGKDIPALMTGLGIELGGHVDGRTGSVLYSPNLGWTTAVELGPRLQSATQLPTVVENDVNALAIHQQLFGKGAGAEWFGVILIGEGIGSGLILDGRLAHGVSGMAGELGHLVVEPRSLRKCRCGNRGCLEAMASTKAVVRAARRRNSAVQDFAAVVALANCGDEDMRKLLVRGANAVGVGISMVLNLTNLERLLIAVPEALGDRDCSSRSTFELTVRAAVQRHTFSTAANDCQLIFESLNEVYGAQGAAAAVLARFVSRPLSWEPVPTKPTGRIVEGVPPRPPRRTVVPRH